MTKSHTEQPARHEADEFVEIGAGEAREVAIAGLVFRARRRKIGDDGGPSLEIIAPVAGTPTPIVRFDLFEHDPHFHAPASDPIPSPLAELPFDFDTRGANGEIIERLLAGLPVRLGALFERAGQPQLARDLDLPTLRMGVDALRALLSGLEPPASLQRYPLTPQLRRQLGLPGGED